jgi:hypothetical protein
MWYIRATSIIPVPKVTMLWVKENFPCKVFTLKLKIPDRFIGGYYK